MLKIGVVGAGHLGKIHIKLLKELPDFDLVGFYDINEEQAKQVASDISVNKYDSFDSLLSDVDAVDIVTPTINHFEYASKALRKGKHVFIEKPISSTVDEAKKIVDLSQEANVKVQVGHVERFNPAFIAASPYIQSPMFIETHRLAQFNPRGTDVSVILDLMIHDLDIVLSLVKSDIKKISANGVSVVSSTPDISNARIEFDNGCVANLTSSRISLKNMRKTRIFQKDAYISIDFLEKTTEIIRIQPVLCEVNDPFAIIIDTGNENEKKQLLFEKPVSKEINSIKSELEHFYSSIKNNTPTPVTAIDGYKALSLAQKIVDKLSLSMPENNIK